MLETPLLEQMIAALPTAYRVVCEDEIGVGARAVYSKHGTHELAMITKTSGGEYKVRYPAPENKNDPLARRSGRTVRIFLDDSLVQTAEWRGHEGDWQAVWISPTGPLLITTNTGPCPDELLLSTTTAADIGL